MATVVVLAGGKILHIPVSAGMIAKDLTESWEIGWKIQEGFAGLAVSATTNAVTLFGPQH